MSESDRLLVQRLADELDAHLIEDVPMNASPYADISSREVHTFPLRVQGSDLDNEDTFWSTLHELGHIASANIAPDTAYWSRQYFDLEAKAWLWAIEHAGRSLSEGARAIIQFAMGSYFADIRLRTSQRIGSETRQLLKLVGATTQSDLIDWFAVKYPMTDVRRGAYVFSDLAHAA